jgi:hypothetical protein
MKVKLLVARAGQGFTQNRGDEIDVGADEGARMLAAGQAELVRGAEAERAVPVKAGREKAVK